MDSLKSGLQVAQVASHGVSILTLTHIFVERLRPILPMFTLFTLFTMFTLLTLFTMFTLFRPRLRRSFHSLASFSTVSWPMKPTGRWSTMCIDGKVKADLGSQEGAREGSNVDRPLVQLDLEDRQLRQDPLPPHLHPLQRHLLDALFQGPRIITSSKTDREI